MLLRTHIMFAILISLIFFNYVNNKFIFVIMVLVATVIPDLDSSRSSYGRHLVFRPLQFITKHRGIFHSFTTAVILAGLIAIKWPIASFGFFIGFSVHLILDSFTKEGIVPFWPLKWKSNGPLVSGGRIEETLFLGLIFIDVLLFFLIVIFV